MGAFIGLETTGVGQVVKAMGSKTRLPVVWFHFQECTGCSESFVRTYHPLVSEIILNKISLDYTETLQAAKPNPTGSKPVNKIVSDKPIINIPGCPPIAEVIIGTIVHILTFDRIPHLDGQKRPKAFYSRRYTIHATAGRIMMRDCLYSRSMMKMPSAVIVFIKWGAGGL